MALSRCLPAQNAAVTAVGKVAACAIAETVVQLYLGTGVLPIMHIPLNVNVSSVFIILTRAQLPWEPLKTHSFRPV